MIFQLFFECSDIPEICQTMINIPCIVVRRENRICVLLSYEELNAYMVESLGVESANLTHIVLGDEKDVL